MMKNEVSDSTQHVEMNVFGTLIYIQIIKKMKKKKKAESEKSNERIRAKIHNKKISSKE